MAQEKMTIERLAEMINEGLKPTASNEDIKEVRSEVVNLRTEIRAEFDRIESLLLEEQKREIENLEARMKKTRRRPRHRALLQKRPGPSAVFGRPSPAPEPRRSSRNRLVIQRSPGGLLFWRSTDEDLTQGTEVAQRLHTARHQPMRRGRRRK